MTTPEMIQELREMQSQIIHGTTIFGEIADRLEQLKDAETYGAHKDETATVFMNQVKKLQDDNASLRKKFERAIDGYIDRNEIIARETKDKRRLNWGQANLHAMWMVLNTLPQPNGNLRKAIDAAMDAQPQVTISWQGKPSISTPTPRKD